MTAAAISAKPTTPPTTPPAIAPVSDALEPLLLSAFEELEGVAELEDDEGVLLDATQKGLRQFVDSTTRLVSLHTLLGKPALNDRACPTGRVPAITLVV